MGEAIQYFLLVFDRASSCLVEEISLGADAESAADTYTQTEQRYKDQHAVEVVLIGSDSIDTVRVTHANYFPPTPAETRYFAEL